MTTKYVYGRGLIGEEVDNTFKTYHFDCRGSTVAITDASGNITDTFAYDTYGKLLTRTGTSNVIFGYNGRDGVVSDSNGLVYMRARYYSPEMRRFVNADIVAGKLSNAITLNRFAYANGNPVSFVDPFGLSAERGGWSPTPLEAAYMADHIYNASIKDYDKPLGDEFGGWELYKILVDKDGFKIGVYVKNEGGKIGYVVVNKGTTTLNDWGDNFAQPFGNSEDMKESISYAKDFVKEHPTAQITFVGHSKGGAEAAANAVATNKDYIIFNPASVALSEYGLSSDDYDANMTAYIVQGEILNNMFGLISAPIDKMVYIKTPWWKNVAKYACFGLSLEFIDSINKHLMHSVIESLKYEKIL